MPDLQKISDDADMIVCGAAVMAENGSLIETNMDDIEFSIAQKYYIANAKYMEI